jgi:rhodanese-related sulfurtransferase
MIYSISKYFWLVLLLLVTATSCGQKTFKEMADEMAANKAPFVQLDAIDSSVVLLDCRARDEYDVSHIPGAIWVGDDIKAVEGFDKNKKYIVYCSVGYRSGKYAEKMNDKGFSNAFNLWGGIFHFINSGNKVVDADGITDKVHPYNEKWGQWLTKGVKSYE